MKALLEAHPEAVGSLRFAILETAPLTMKPDAIARLEQSYMRRLCSREIGLN